MLVGRVSVTSDDHQSHYFVTAGWHQDSFKPMQVLSAVNLLTGGPAIGPLGLGIY